MQNLNIDPLEFLAAFHDFPDEPVFFRAFDDTKQKKGASNRTVEFYDWEREYETLKAANERKCGIYFVVNGGGNTDAEVKTAKAQFVEMDNASFDEQFQRVSAFPLEPSIIVKTRKSLHCYWLIHNGDITRFRAIQERLAQAFDGDPVCKNESRVMRVPGFNHCKGEPVMVECVKFDPGIIYTQDDLSNALPELRFEHRERVSVGIAIIRGCRNQTLFKLACSLQQQGLSDAAIVGVIETENATKCSPPLDTEEVEQIIASALKYQKGAIATVADAAIPPALEEIPKWTSADYDTNAPYAWLYAQKPNGELREAILKDKIRAAAASVNVKNFVMRYNAYCKSQARRSGKSLEPSTEFADQPIELLCGEYTCNEYGVSKVDRFGNSVSVISHAILPLRRLVNVDTGEVKIEIAYRRGRGWRTIVCDKRMLSSSQKIIELAMYGIGVNSQNAPDLVKFITDVEEMNYDRIEEMNSVGRLGWIRSGDFSPYVDELRFDGDLCFKSMFDSVKPRGEYEKWLECAGKIRSGGIVARIMLAASFASALVQPLGGLPFFLHVWGGTETGKTVGLMLAASVWANPAMGEYISTFNSTSVGLEMRAGFVNSLPLCIDELQVIKERKDFDTTVYMLAEGIGRNRGAKAGGLQRLQTWKNCIITTGEMPICTSVSGGGAVNRIIDIDCRDEKLFIDPHGVVECIAQNYGHAGKAFIDGIIPIMDIAKAVQRDFYAELLASETTEKQALASSMILAADQAADLLLFQDGKNLTVQDIMPYLASKAEVSANERAFEWLLDLVSSNPSRFKPTSQTGEYVGECWGCVDNEHAYFIKSVFDAKMNEAGFNPTAFLSWAKRDGKLDHDHGRTTKVKHIPGLATQARCVCLNLPVLMEEVTCDF